MDGPSAKRGMALLGGAVALRRFWIEKEELKEGVFSLTGELFHHLVDVCRIGEGHEFELLPGDGSAYLVKALAVGKKELQVESLSVRPLPALPRPYVHLYVSVPRLPKLDGILEKSVELGVKKVTPFLSDFSFLRKESEISSNRKVRWEKIVKGATRQCGRGDLMEIGEVEPLSRILSAFNRSGRTLGLFPFEGEGSMTLKQSLRSLKVQDVDEVAVFVGSEGGFSVKEVKRFQELGMEPLTLGDQVLRVETACLALVSILKYELNL